MQLTQEEMDGLSQAEIDAINEKDDDDGSAGGDLSASEDGKTDGGGKPAVDDPGKKPDENLSGDDHAKAVAEAEAAAKAEEDAKAKAEADAAAAAAASKPDDKTETPPAKPSVPLAPPPASMQPVDPAKLEEAKTNYEQAKEKFNAGEIQFDEFDEFKTAYNELKWKSDMAEQYNLSARESAWKWEQQMFFSQNRTFESNQTINLAFVATVNRLINSDEGKTLSDRDVLQRAKEIVSKDLNLAAPPAGQTDAEKERARQEAIRLAKKTQGDRSDMGADLGAVPAAGSETDQDEFAHIDKLEGAAYQAAIEAMSPEQLARYENRV